MSPEEKKTILQFMGQTYGQTHKLDQDIVGTSQFLKPTSGAIREKFEEVLRAPLQESIKEASILPFEPTKIIEPSIPAPFIQPEEIKASIHNNQPVHTPQVDSQITAILAEINLNLVRIGDILERATNGRPKKIKNTGSE